MKTDKLSEEDIDQVSCCQGGAVSLRTALTSDTPLAGCLALSCYLPGDPGSYKSCDHQVPVFQVRLLVILLYLLRMS